MLRPGCGLGFPHAEKKRISGGLYSPAAWYNRMESRGVPDTWLSCPPRTIIAFGVAWEIGPEPARECELYSLWFFYT